MSTNALPYAALPVQLLPTFGGPLDKRTVGDSQSYPQRVGAGQLFFNTDEDELYVYNGADWLSVSSGGVSYPGLGYNINGTSTLQSFYNSAQDLSYDAAATGLNVFLTHNRDAGITYVKGRSVAHLLAGNTEGIEANLNNVKSNMQFDVMNTSTTTDTALTVKTGKLFEVENRFKVTSNEIELRQNMKQYGVDSETTFQGTVYVDGDLYVDNQLVTTTALTTTLFGSDIANTHVVKNAIGLVAENTTVAQLISTYGTVQKLLAAMLKLQPPSALTPQGLSLTVSYTTTTPTLPSTLQLDTMVGTLIEGMRLLISYNRGSWSSTPSEGTGYYPYGRATAIRYIEPFTSTQITVPLVSNVVQDGAQPVVFTSDFVVQTFTVSHTSLVTYDLTAGLSMDIAAGAIVTNASGTYQVTARTLTPTTSKKIRLYAPVKVRLSDNTIIDNAAPAGSAAGSGGDSKEPSDDKLFGALYQSEVRSANFNPLNTLCVPIREPTKLYVYVTILGSGNWVEQSPMNEIVDVTPESLSINGNNVQYYMVKFKNTNRDPSDMKVGFD